MKPIVIAMRVGHEIILEQESFTIDLVSVLHHKERLIRVPEVM